MAKRTAALELVPNEGRCDVKIPASFKVGQSDTAVWEVTSGCPDAQVVELVFKNPRPVDGNLTSRRPGGSGKRWPDIVATVVGKKGTRHKYDVHVNGKMVLDPDLEIDPT